MKGLYAMPLLLLIAACASKPQRLVESEWTSMSKSKIPDVREVTEVGPVNGKYCYSTFSSGHHGLMDEAILDAQKKFGVDYIRNATFMIQKNEACVSVEGIGYKTKNI